MFLNWKFCLEFWSSILHKFIKWHVWQIFRDGFPRLISSSIFGNYLYLIVVNFHHGFLQKSTKKYHDFYDSIHFTFPDSFPCFYVAFIWIILDILDILLMWQKNPKKYCKNCEYCQGHSLTVSRYSLNASVFNSSALLF